MVSLTPEVKQQLKYRQNLDLQNETGVLIVEVVPNSPAAQAGLRSGDILKAIAETQITSTPQVQDIVETTPPGEELPLEVLRDNSPINLTVIVGILPN